MTSEARPVRVGMAGRVPAPLAERPADGCPFLCAATQASRSLHVFLRRPAHGRSHMKPPTSSCTASHCLCVIGNDMAIATTSTQDCPEHGENGYHPDVVMWDCHEPETTATVTKRQRDGEHDG
jgi:hypothetical protein